MANIDIFNLDASGSELFNDSENFLADLDEQEQLDVGGGITNVANSFTNIAIGSANLVVSVTNISGGATVTAGGIGQFNTVRN